MSDKKLILSEEFERIFARIKSGEPLALLRYGDGERMIMRGEFVRAQEGWQVQKEGNEALSAELRSCLELSGAGVIHAISCPCCDFVSHYFYSSRLRGKEITFANIFINCNYQRFKAEMAELDEEAILIANHRANIERIGKLLIKAHYKISDDCASFYREELDALCEQIYQEQCAPVTAAAAATTAQNPAATAAAENPATENPAQNQRAKLFIISAGPLAEIIIKRLYLRAPQHRYIDVGSAIDEFFKPQSEWRPYTQPESFYARSNCQMNAAAPSLRVVLTLHKRPHVLGSQLEAVRAQSLQPSCVMLYQDGEFADIKIPDELKNSFDEYAKSAEPQGVWARFKQAHESILRGGGGGEEFCAMFDDDTIPSEDFLANCAHQMSLREGLYATRGILMKNPALYPNDKDLLCVGWDGPNEHTQEVDFAGHAWYFRSEWLADLLAAPEAMQHKLAGEDIAFSLMLQRRGIPTLVPPHPRARPNLWGAQPALSLQFGCEEVGISMNAANAQRFNAVMLCALENGFKALIERDLAAYKRALRPVPLWRALAERWLLLGWLRRINDGYIKPLERKIRHRLRGK